jgi:hypothetical protein
MTINSVKWPKKHFRIILLLWLLLLPTSAVHAQTPLDIEQEVNARIQAFEKKYGIPLVYKNLVHPSGDLHFVELARANYAELNTYLKLFNQEINKYPSSFFKSQNIRGIALVKRLFIQGKPAEGLYFFNYNVMFFDILRNNHKRVGQRHSIHHELFHMMQKRIPNYTPLNPDIWTSWNQPSFQYNPRTRLSRKTNPFNYYAPHEPGFVTYYAMTSVDEDQAEVFACLMQYKHKQLIDEWIQNDRIMAKKVSAIKGFVKLFCPDMDEQFWDTIKN